MSSLPPKLKARVLSSLTRLSDRDTFSIASSELDTIARSLPPDSLPPFLHLLSSSSDSSTSTPVRRHSLRLLTLLSASHGDALSPHLPKLLSAIVRRLRDPDTATRAAAVEAAGAVAGNVTGAPFSAVFNPLMECVFHEQDFNAQAGAVLCAAAAVEAAPEVERGEMRKVVGKLMRLIKNDCFKAKAGLLLLIGSIVSVGGVLSRNLLGSLVNCVVECLGSDDWAVRKAAAETLGKIALLGEGDRVVEQKGLCISSLENRKFDKVKIVREAMNRALEAWREIPEKESMMQSQSKSLSKDTSSGESSSRISPRTSCDSAYVTPQPKKKAVLSRSSSVSSNSSITSSLRRSVSKSDNVKLNVERSLKTELKNDKVEVDQPLATTSAENDNCFNSKREAKGAPPRGASGDKSGQFNKSRYTSRVVPFCEDDHLQGSVVTADAEDISESQKEFEGMSLIREQLAQIENQQSNLLELLQIYIGSSQSGMNSLQKRVNGLEKALDEMSHDLGISTRRISNSDSSGNTCCLLPGAEFLSPKFWRKTEGQSSNGKSSFFSKDQSIYNMLNTGDTFETPKYQQFSSKSTNDDIETVESHMSRRTFSKHSIDKNPQACSAGEVLVRNVRQQAYATGRV